MGEQNSKGLFGYLSQCGREIIYFVIEWVVNSGQPDRFVAPTDFRSFVDKHANAHLFQLERDGRFVVISENPVDTVPRTYCREKLPNATVDFLAGTFVLKTIVTSDHAQVSVDTLQDGDEALSQAVNTVYVQIGEMENAEAIERTREMGKPEFEFGDNRTDSVPRPALIKPEHLQSGFDEWGDDALFMLPKQGLSLDLAAATGKVLLDCDAWAQLFGERALFKCGVHVLRLLNQRSIKMVGSAKSLS